MRILSGCQTSRPRLLSDSQAMEYGSTSCRFGDEGLLHVVVEQHFEMTEDESRWIRAVADAAGHGVEQELQSRCSYSDDGDCWLRGYRGNAYTRGAYIMAAALGQFAAPFPAPFSFRVEQWGWDDKLPSDVETWAKAAERWTASLDVEGRRLFEQALEAALALDGVATAKFVQLAAEHIQEEAR